MAKKSLKMRRFPWTVFERVGKRCKSCGWKLFNEFDATTINVHSLHFGIFERLLSGFDFLAVDLFSRWRRYGAAIKWHNGRQIIGMNEIRNRMAAFATRGITFRNHNSMTLLVKRDGKRQLVDCYKVSEVRRGLWVLHDTEPSTGIQRVW